MATLLLRSDQAGTVHEVKPFDRITLEVKENIEALSQELHYLRDKVDWLVQYENRPEELRDAIFKLQDIDHSLRYKKRVWGKLLKKVDLDFSPQPSEALDMLRANAEHLQARLLVKYPMRKHIH